MFIKEKGDEFPLESVADAIAQMFHGTGKKAHQELKHVVLRVTKPVAELETFNELFDSDLYKEYESKFKNPFYKNCNNRRSHLKPNLRAKNGTHLLFHDRTSLVYVGFKASEITDRL